MRFDSLNDVLEAFTAGFIKKALMGAGLTLGTAGGTMIVLDKFIDNMKDSVTQLPPLALALADIAFLDYYVSCVLGAIVTKSVLHGSSLTLKRLE
ncbi:DUF2523 family protein [Moraxella sp. VT-16-12]|uniref:DUF2523 family protein n=1 Tax=Moraxella sp. VT-16-12 TaxID=2014877 RepID=UPI000B7CAD32|nr:DUF2523 family protein [Moraxella sp. VT-16-12]